MPLSDGVVRMLEEAMECVREDTEERALLELQQLLMQAQAAKARLLRSAAR